MDKMVVLQMMADLDNAYSQKDVIVMTKNQAIASVLTPAIQAELEGIDMEFQEDLDVMAELIKDREQATKDAVLQYGSGVKNEFLNITRSEGRVSYDAKGLDAYLVELEKVEPALAREMMAFRKQGNPYASIRKR